VIQVYGFEQIGGETGVFVAEIAIGIIVGAYQQPPAGAAYADGPDYFVFRIDTNAGLNEGAGGYNYFCFGVSRYKIVCNKYYNQGRYGN